MAINPQRIIYIAISGMVVFISFMANACGGASPTTPASNDSPTEAYKRLFAAVKSKDTNAIKNEMSRQSVALVGKIAGMQNKPVEEVYANGLTSTLHAETLPEIRDERIKDGSGAIEVYNVQERKWDDIPFIAEDGKWKLAIGDAYNGNFKSPGKGRDQKEKEAANVFNTSAGQSGTSNNSNAANVNLPATKLNVAPPPE